MSLFIPPNARATDAAGAVLPGACWYFYLSGTKTAAPTYTTSARTTAHANPVVADSGGMFANIFLDPTITYRAVLTTAGGATIGDFDPYVAFEAVGPLSFGVVGDGATDDTAALQAWLDYCGTKSIDVICAVTLSCSFTDTLTFPGGTHIDVERISFTYSGPADRPALVVPGTLRKTLRFGLVEAKAIDWTNIDFIGVQLKDVYGCEIQLKQISQFAVGYELYSSLVYGVAHNAIWPGTIRDCHYCEVLRSLAQGFVNENSFYSGNYGNTSNADGFGDAYGTLLTWDKEASDRGHNNNRWFGPNYEMGAPESATYRVPMLFDGVGVYNNVYSARQESNKGPFAILDGGLQYPGGTEAHSNNFNATYNISIPEQEEYVLQVNGAYGNLYTGPGCSEHFWQSGDLQALVGSNGPADTAYIRGETFFMVGGVGTPTRAPSGAGLVATARDSVHLVNCGIFVAVDTSVIKTFRLFQAAKSGSEGQVYISAFDATGARLAGNATDPVWGDEPYVKGGVLAASPAFGGGYTVPSENFTSDYLFTVREEVQKIYVGYGYGGTVLQTQSLSLIGYSTQQSPSQKNSAAGMRVFADLGDDGSQPLATCNPAAAGTHGCYAAGQVVGNAGAAAGQPAGWQCSTAGRLAPAWAASTAYADLGQIVTNDNGNMYELATAGTSAGSGGPTGEGTPIEDGSCAWNYIGVKAAFVTLGVTS